MWDYRSDTVTKPTPAMREAMATAEVGDDVFGEDPTTQALERRAAEVLGKQAALFVPSGTMGNLLALLIHCKPGDQAIVEARSHCLHNEQNGAARFGGVQLIPVLGDAHGALDLDELQAHVRDHSLYCGRTAVVVVENTHNFAGGRIQPHAHTVALSAFAKSRNIAMHLDGARIWHAHVASGLSLPELTAPFDSVVAALSKSLGAPVGAVLCGSVPFVAEARRLRKALGGGMRQVGIVAAAGLLALEPANIAALAADHSRAKRLATAFASSPNLVVQVADVETNLVFVRHKDGGPAEEKFAKSLCERGVLCINLPGLGVRFVTHGDLDDDAIAQTIEIVNSVAA